MDTNKKMKAERLQAKLDELLQKKEKKQAAFEKAKKELTAISKNIDGVKLQLFEILQSGSDDTAFSNWAKRKITENGNPAKSENGNSVKSEKPIYPKTENPDKPNPVNSEKPTPQNPPPQTGQNHNQPQRQNHQPHTAQNQNQR